MKTSLSFFVPGKPIAQPRHQIKGRHRYIKRLSDGSPHPIHAWKEWIALTAKLQEWDIVKMPDAIEMTLIFAMKRPKTNKLLFPTGKPDRDNLEKAVTDALEGILFENDSQIIDGPIKKIYGDYDGGGVLIEIRWIKNENMSI